MELTGKRAQEILEGIRDLASKLGDFDPKKYRVKGGGAVHQAAIFDWYFSDQNIEGSVDSKAAYEGGLIRRTYGIFKASPNSPTILRILEWSATEDKGGSEYRMIWTRSVDEKGANKTWQNFSSIIVSECSSVVRPSRRT